nr:GNAT family N-acetyltransferase [Halopolyspora algeriensis]
MLDSYNVVVLLNHCPVGMVGGIPGGHGTGELKSVWVGPQARGRGVGDRLVIAVQDRAVRRYGIGGS